LAINWLAIGWAGCLLLLFGRQVIEGARNTDIDSDIDDCDSDTIILLLAGFFIYFLIQYDCILSSLLFVLS